MELKAILAPQTHLRLDLAGLLLAAFDRIILLQPSEEKLKGPLENLIKKGLVEIITPPPLGDKLPWFQKLIASYEEWGQMMRWPENVAMFKARPEVLEETVSEIKAQILGKEVEKPNPDLQARIILQLAQNLDKRLEELDFEYQDLKAHAEKLSDFIVGHDPTVRRFPDWVIEGKETNHELPNIQERMLAFAHLMGLIEKLPTDKIVSDQLEFIETLLDFAQEAKKLGKVSLPPIEKDLDLDASKECKEKILAVLAGNYITEENCPYLEIWELPFETKSLLVALKNPNSLKKGRTYLFYLGRA